MRKTLRSFVNATLPLALIPLGLLLSQPLRAGVTATLTPAAVSNTYNGSILLVVSNLAGGDTVVVQKYLDLNQNGVVDAGDWLVQQYNLTDGQAGMVIGGVTNGNVPGDTDTTPGQITAKLHFQGGDFMQNLVGQYLYVVSSPGGHFTPITNLFTVTNFPYGQQFTGIVYSNSTSTTVPGAVVLLFPPPRPGHSGPGGSPQAGVVADRSGSFTMAAPAGTYMPTAFIGNGGYVANYAASPVLTLGSGATLGIYLTLTNATATITGRIVDANHAGVGLPGVFMPAMSGNGLIAATVTDSNGNFTMPVTADQWALGSDDSGLIVHGYAGWNNDTNVNAGATGVTLAYPQATALFYGTVMDSLGNPLPGLDVDAYDNNNQYDSDSATQKSGNYSVAALGGLNNDPWQVQISGKTSLSNYLFSQPDFDSNSGTNLGAGQALLVNFTGLLATNTISGSLQDGGGHPIPGVGVWANATINGVYYNQGSVDTDINGNYSLNAANGTWTIGVNTCGDCGDGLPGNYLSPENQSVVISNNNGTANFTTLLVTNQITGYLTNAATGLGIANVGVPAWATINGVQYMQYARTDGNGFYSNNVPNGTWSVNLNTGSCGDCLSSSLYLCPDSSQTVVISNDNAVVDFAAVPVQAQIAGYVKDNNNNPIAGVGVWANATINGQNYNQGSVDTDANGHYSIGVVNGAWSVGVSTCSDCSDGLPGNYLSPPNQSVVIANNNGTANFTAILATNTISGFLKDNNGNPIAGVGWVWANATINGVDYYVGSEDTDANGNYSLSVANGTWTVGVNGGGGGDSLPGDLIFANQSVVIANNNGTANFTALLANGGISGFVQQSSGNPIAGVFVLAYATINSANYFQYGTTDASGHYGLPAPNGSWSVSVFCSGGPGANLDSILGSGNYQCPNNQGVTINNDNPVVNFTVQINSQPVLSSAFWQTNQFQMRLTGLAGQNYTVQMSTNLSNWTALFVTNNALTNSFLVTDPNATNKQRSYRIKIGP